MRVIEPEVIFPIEIKENNVQQVLHNEMVIMIGFPGSGKSTFVKNNFSNYTILSGDELKTEAKIIKELNKNIGKSSIVIDATNPTKDKRKKFIDIAKQNNIPVRCIYMNVSKEQALLQNNKRDKPVPAIVFNIFNKRFEYPTEDEGCSVVII
jgi:bifunctional polynucleotide phosphatase/kinase